jgi:hypothetical protein
MRLEALIAVALLFGGVLASVSPALVTSAEARPACTACD